MYFSTVRPLVHELQVLILSHVLNLGFNLIATSRKLRLIDVHFFQTKPYSLGEFENEVNNQIENVQNILLNAYYQEVQNIFLQGDKKGRLPNPANKKKMEHFYSCASNVMAIQLQNLCLKTLYEYTHYLHDYGVS